MLKDAVVGLDEIEHPQPSPTRLTRIDADSGEVEFHKVQLAELQALLKDRHRFILTRKPGPTPIRCKLRRKNLFALFMTHEYGSLVLSEPARLQPVVTDLARDVSHWLGGADFALVIYRDDENTGRPLNTPVALVANRRQLPEILEIGKAIVRYSIEAGAQPLREPLPSYMLVLDPSGTYRADPIPITMEPERKPPTPNAAPLLGWAELLGASAAALATASALSGWNRALIVASLLAFVPSLVLYSFARRD